MTEFGTCQVDGCTEHAIVKLNQKALCLDHFDAGLTDIGKAVDSLVGPGAKRTVTVRVAGGEAQPAPAPPDAP